MANVSQQQLADLSGVAKPTIANIERGIHRTAKLDTLEKLAKALKCDVSQLTGERISGDFKVIDEFLESSIARELNLDPSEIAWLRELRINWLNRTPSHMSILSMIEALRYSRE